MNVLAIHGSPRKNGNSRLLLDRAMAGAERAGGKVTLLRPAEMDIAPCMGCEACRDRGRCVQQDDMDRVGQLIEHSQVVLLACPVYFLGPPAQLKALIDRCQARWWPLQNLAPGARTIAPTRRGALLSVAAASKPATFSALRSITRAFFWSNGVDYCKELFLGGLDQCTDNRPSADDLRAAENLGYETSTDKS